VEELLSGVKLLIKTNVINEGKDILGVCVSTKDKESYLSLSPRKQQKRHSILKETTEKKRKK